MLGGLVERTVEQAATTSAPVARISLASANTPATRTAHSITVRCRVQSTAIATVRGALYEGSNNRSGDLESAALTNALASYTLSVADASAANITDYSNLEIRLWGFSMAGDTPVLEVAEISLTIPNPTAFVPPFRRHTPLATANQTPRARGRY